MCISSAEPKPREYQNSDCKIWYFDILLLMHWNYIYKSMQQKAFSVWSVGGTSLELRGGRNLPLPKRQQEERCRNFQPQRFPTLPKRNGL